MIVDICVRVIRHTITENNYINTFRRVAELKQ